MLSVRIEANDTFFNNPQTRSRIVKRSPTTKASKPSTVSGMVRRRAADWADLSVTVADHEVTSFGRDSVFPANRSTVFDDSLDYQTLPAVAGADDVTEMFFEVSQNSRPADVADTLLRFIQICEDSLEKLHAWERFTPQNCWLAEECNTWRLLHCLHINGTQTAELRIDAGELETLSPKDRISSYFRKDEDVRLTQTVIDWLEKCTAHQDPLIPPADQVGGNLHWENTLHHLQNGISLFDGDRGSSLITALDPDAPRRQRKNLHALDRQDDDSLCRRLFKELRCGRFEEVVSLCVDAGQMWRAIILQGQRLLDYPESAQIDTKLPLIGNPARNLWKWNCIEFLKNSEDNLHFKACIGALCGHLPSVLPICGSTWEDLLWCHLRTQMEAKVDNYLKEYKDLILISPSDDILIEFESFERPQEMTLQQVFTSVKASYGNRSETFYQETQRHLILDETNLLYLSASSWIQTADYHFIRFLAHLVIVLRQINKDAIYNIGNDILKSYVEKLIENINVTLISPELIAYYVSTLPLKTRIELFSKFMWLVESKNDRIKVITAATDVGLDILSMTKETVRYAIKLLKENLNFSIKNNENQRSIICIINSLEWLSFHSSQIPEAVSMSNAIIRIFILRSDVESANAVLNKLTQFYPSSMIAQNLENTSNVLREHFCLKAYLEAISGYAAWYRQYVGGRPKSPEPLMPDCSFTDRVHYEQLKAQILLQQEQWNVTGTHQTNHIKQLLYNVLLFPEGWMVDDVASKEITFDSNLEEFTERNNQLQVLRKMCIPEIVLLLLKVLQNNTVENHVEAVRLSELLASDKRKLYLLFPKNKLREVLQRIGESSLSLLENDHDAWGFESNNL